MLDKYPANLRKADYLQLTRDAAHSLTILAGLSEVRDVRQENSKFDHMERQGKCA